MAATQTAIIDRTGKRHLIVTRSMENALHVQIFSGLNRNWMIPRDAFPKTECVKKTAEQYHTELREKVIKRKQKVVATRSSKFGSVRGKA